MNERVMQTRVGLMVLSVLLITLILVVLFGEGPHAMKGKVTVRMIFAEAPMVMKDTPVRKSGVMLGRVTNVSLREDGRVEVSASIDADAPVFSTDVARISTALIGGDAVVNFVPGKSIAPRSRVKGGEEIEGMTYSDPIMAITNLQDRLSGAIGSVTNTSNELGQVVHQVGDLIQTNQEKINRIVAQADDVSRDMKELVRGMNDTFGNPETRAKIKETADNLPELVRTTRDTIAQSQKVIAGLDKNLQNVDKFTTALGEQGQATINRIGNTTENLDRLVNELTVMSKSINSGEGTFGQLVHNRELYDNLNQTVATVESLSRELRPIVRDARVFSDRLARHPEDLILGGVNKRSDGTKW